MIPELTSDGRLPPGIHQATLDEFKERFAVFSRSDRRLRLFDKLRRLIEEAGKSGIVTRVIVGGSYVTQTPEPNDFDCILVIDPEIIDRELRPFEYNLVSRRMARRVFAGDILPALQGSVALNDYIEFFQKTRDGEPVGVVEIEP